MMELHFPAKFAKIELYLWHFSDVLKETLSNIRYEWMHVVLSLVIYFPNNKHKFYAEGVENFCQL